MTSIFSRRSFFKGLLSATAVGLVPFSQAANALPSGLGVQATKAALAGDFITAGDLANRSGESAAVKLVELLYLRDHAIEAGYARIMSFLSSAPKWPLTETLMKRAELALYKNQENARIVLAHFGARKPGTPLGMLALARSSYSIGNSTQGKLSLENAWNNPAVDADLEKLILAEFGSQLTTADHRQRVWRLIYAQESSAAIRNAKRLGGVYADAALAAQALLNEFGGAERQYANLPVAMKNEPALKFALAHYYRKQEDYSKARSILASVSKEALATDPEGWWNERRIIIRRSVGPNHIAHWNTAYKMAKIHGGVTGDSLIEAEFLAGWIALRYLKKPNAALAHFSHLQSLASSRTDQARAAYWIGRTYLALRNRGNAGVAFHDAAKHSTVYYGQLAREQIGLGQKPEAINGGQSSATAQTTVNGDEVVQAYRLMAQVGAKNELNMFLWSLANRFDSVDEMNAVAAIVQNTAGTSWALRLAKGASQRGIDIDSWSYPLRGLPSWAQIGKPIEKSLVFALSRQESEFDPSAGSSVGAQGLMQLMPATARLVARQYNVAFAPAKLKSDPAYNVKLGAAHLADLVDNFNGSYVLTLVAYNAGPRRSREWVDEFGDPRNGQVDAVDWVECVPFEETRQYIQKVLQNVHVYRSRLAPQTVQPMSADLNRGTPADIAVASTSPIATRVMCKNQSIASLISSCK
jgi:soluble lytic murein transglycosylase